MEGILELETFDLIFYLGIAGMTAALICGLIIYYKLYQEKSLKKSLIKNMAILRSIIEKAGRND